MRGGRGKGKGKRGGGVGAEGAKRTMGISWILVEAAKYEQKKWRNARGVIGIGGVREIEHSPTIFKGVWDKIGPTAETIALNTVNTARTHSRNVRQMGLNALTASICFRLVLYAAADFRLAWVVSVKIGSTFQ